MSHWPAEHQPIMGSHGYGAGQARMKKFVAVGIDFGTTYSGVSWALSERPDEFFEISEWPAAYSKHQQEVQVPSQIDLDSKRWGYLLTPSMSSMKWIKLLLLRDEDLKKKGLEETPKLQEAKKLLQRPGAPTATKVVAEYLTRLWEHTYSQLKSKISIERLAIRVAITVPAIWPHYAAYAMEEAARIAGITTERDIGPTPLTLVQEPEAAALSIMFDRDSVYEPQVGDSFIVCDAGGGTVDVISYTVTSTTPFQMCECIGGEGSLDGAFLIDEAFESHMKSRKLKIASLKETEYGPFFHEGWELGAKRTFSDEDQPAKFFIQLPSEAYHMMDRMRGRDNFYLSRDEVRTFFSKALTGIRMLLSSQNKKIREKTGKETKMILLAGGLGSSPYVYKVLNQLFKDIVLRPRNLWSAVARGAVIRLLRDSMDSQPILTPPQYTAHARMPNIVSRKSRYSYGVEILSYVDEVHDFDQMKDEVSFNAEGRARVWRMRWYVTKGEDMSSKQAVRFGYYREARHHLPTSPPSMDIMICSEDAPPSRKNSTVSTLRRMESQWDRPFESWTPVGNPAAGWRRYEGLALALTFDGQLRFRFEVGSNEDERVVPIQYLDH